MPSRIPGSCDICGDLFEGPKWQRYCSQAHARISRKTRKKTITCIKCNKDIDVHVQTSQQYCIKCQPQKFKRKEIRKKSFRRSKIKSCLDCKNDFLSLYAFYCPPCRKDRQRKSGLKSAQIQAERRRGSNEILFANKCINHFQQVTINDAVFEGWDADILVWEHKIAVLWNGPWHYKKLRRKHSVEQVQARDRVKLSVIKRLGWTSYVIKDEHGKKNDVKLVDNEFEKFLRFIE